MIGLPLFLIFFLAIYLMSSIKILAEYERGVIFRLGRILDRGLARRGFVGCGGIPHGSQRDTADFDDAFKGPSRLSIPGLELDRIAEKLLGVAFTPGRQRLTA